MLRKAAQAESDRGGPSVPGPLRSGLLRLSGFGPPGGKGLPAPAAARSILSPVSRRAPLHRVTLGIALLSAGLLALAGCEAPKQISAARPASAAPKAAQHPLATPKTLRDTRKVKDPEKLSLMLRGYYGDAETGLKRQGRMRTDTAPADAPLTRERLVTDFIDTALFDEYVRTRNAGYVSRKTPARLRRWAEPVRIAPEFGATVPAAAQAADRAALSDYARQLAQATRHPVETVPKDGNLTVFFVDEEERRALPPRLRTLVPGIDAGTLDTIARLSPSTFCAAFAFADPGTPQYTRAIAVIRAELPADLSRSCIDEELAQAMGLPNDSPAARPSIFNDDEEFARLTRHDELLLRILYDPRLSPGMTAAEARPIVRTIAAELIGQNS